MPMLHIISHYGVLCSFNVINITQAAAQICTKPEPIPDQSGINQFIIPKQTMAAGEPKPQSQTKPQTPTAAIKPVAPQPMQPSQSVIASQPVATSAIGQQVVSVQPIGNQQPSNGTISSIASSMGQISASGAPSFGGFSFAGATAALGGSPATAKPQTAVSMKILHLLAFAYPRYPR